MILIKTPAGQQALKERTALAPRQRPAFILFDGRRSVEEVLAATASMGITMDDVQAMLELGLLAPASGPAGALDGAAGRTGDRDSGSTAPAAAPGPGSGRTPMQRYQSAYPVAIELTASLGLRGFRLNLAVEGTTGYEQLAQLAPRIQEAVGDARYARLASALFD